MSLITINTAEFKEQFADLINQVAHNKDRVLLTRRDKEIAVIIPMEDYKLLLTAQDKIDLHEAMESLKEAREKGSISLNKLKDEIGA